MSKTRRKKAKLIHIHGRRWFERVNGNTYHTCAIWVDGEPVHKVPFTYGYGSQYAQSARLWLEENGYLPGIEHRTNGCHESLWCYCQRVGVKLVDDVTNVGRKRDL